MGYQIKQSMDSNRQGVSFAKDSANAINQYASVATKLNSRDADTLTAGEGTTQSIFMPQTSRDQEDGGVNTGTGKNQNNSLYATTNDGDNFAAVTNQSLMQDADVDEINNAMANS